MIARLSTVALLGLVPLGPMALGSPLDEPAGATEAEAGAVPAAFEPLAPLVGRWRGQAVPADDPLRGWREAHEWAWAFEGGEPVAMTLTIEGGKVLSAARLTFDAESETYRLEGTDPRGEAVAFVGPRDPRTNALTLDRSGPGGEERLTIRPNANGIRSDFWFDRKEPNSPQYARLVRANLGKEGVSFAAGGSTASGPECIVTGGAATITVSAGGSTFAVCCSGCRDEVVADPEKYARKLRAAMASPGTPAAARPPADDGAFDPPPAPAPRPSGPDAPAPPRPAAGPNDAPPAPEPAPAPPDAEARRKAASLLRLGRSLEGQGKADGALGFYRRVVAEAPGTPEAAEAATRIKAIGGDD